MNYKNLGMLDIALIKLAVLAGAFFLVSVWYGLGKWVISTHWGWFLGIAIVLSIKPLIKVLKG